VETTNQEKPLSIAMREIQAGVVEAHEMDAEEIAAQAAAAQEAPSIELDDPFADLADPNA
ncbi:MAG: DNA-directed RNA polymerase subunit omega, partial [Cutibacterium avidum]|nr:DNA-directed RNA polymerase subunit omega [Cutibacterium avidum]